MDTQNDNIEDLIAKTIRKAGYEKDMRDLETLKAFTANIKRRNRIRRLLISVTSVAALLALLFSLNIYHDNRIMDMRSSPIMHHWNTTKSWFHEAVILFLPN